MRILDLPLSFTRFRLHLVAQKLDGSSVGHRCPLQAVTLVDPLGQKEKEKKLLTSNALTVPGSPSNGRVVVEKK